MPGFIKRETFTRRNSTITGSHWIWNRYRERPILTRTILSLSEVGNGHGNNGYSERNRSNN